MHPLIEVNLEPHERRRRAPPRLEQLALKHERFARTKGMSAREVLPHFDSANRLIERFSDAGLLVPNLFRPVMDLYSWQEQGAFYNMTLDVEAIGRERTNLIELPDPTLMDELPSAIADILTKPQVFPKPDEQDLLVYDADQLTERLGNTHLYAGMRPTHLGEGAHSCGTRCQRDGAYLSTISRQRVEALCQQSAGRAVRS
jgi:hypothetical protein